MSLPITIDFPRSDRQRRHVVPRRQKTLHLRGFPMRPGRFEPTVQTDHKALNLARPARCVRMPSIRPSDPRGWTIWTLMDAVFVVTVVSRESISHHRLVALGRRTGDFLRSRRVLMVPLPRNLLVVPSRSAFRRQRFPFECPGSGRRPRPHDSGRRPSLHDAAGPGGPLRSRERSGYHAARLKRRSELLAPPSRTATPHRPRAAPQGGHAPCRAGERTRRTSLRAPPPRRWRRPAGRRRGRGPA